MPSPQKKRHRVALCLDTPTLAAFDLAWHQRYPWITTRIGALRYIIEEFLWQDTSRAPHTSVQDEPGGAPRRKRTRKKVAAGTPLDSGAEKRQAPSFRAGKAAPVKQEPAEAAQAHDKSAVGIHGLQAGEDVEHAMSVAIEAPSAMLSMFEQFGNH